MAVGDVTFAVRGNSLDAYRSFSGKTPGLVTGREAVVADANAIGGNTIDLDITGSPNAAKQYLLYNGRNSVPTSQGISVAIRVKIGTSATLCSLWCVSVPFNNLMAQIGMYFRRDTHLTLVSVMNESSQARLSNTQVHDVDLEDGAYHDIVFVDAGDDSAGALKVYLDGVVVYTSGTLANQMDNPKPVDRYGLIALGFLHGVNSSAIIVNEFAIFEGVIDPTNILLEDPDTQATELGSLNGAARTKWIACDPYDGVVPAANYTDPGEENVLKDLQYQYEGETKTGTLETTKTSKVRIIV